MKKFFVVLILFLSFSNVYALEPCRKSSEYTYYEGLSDEDKKDYYEPVFCSNIMNNELSNYNIIGNTMSSLFPNISSSISDLRYNAVDDNIITSPKNQYQTGLCWDFSAISLIETNAFKNGLDVGDLSETHMAYSILGELYNDNLGKVGKYNKGVNGGRITYSPTYMFGGYGQLLENELDFYSNLIGTKKNDLKKINSSNYINGNKMLSVERFSLDNISNYGTCATNEIEKIKDKIIKYGSVQATMYMDQKLFSDAKENYYMSTTSNSSGTNHGVVIVGWDDSISKTNFNGATRDGAWIVKNSWGKTWSDDGYFYISYDDNFICKVVATYDGVSTKKFDYTYKSADVVGSLQFALTGKNYIASKFTKQANTIEVLDRVSFTVGDYSNYKVYLSKGNKLDKSDWILLKSGTSNVFGIDSVDLSDIIIDNDFTIIVEYDFEEGKESSLFMMCNNGDDVNNMDISTGVNFISTNGNNWIDMSNISGHSCEPNLFAYTSLFNNNIELSVDSISNQDDVINVSFTKKNINSSDILFKVYDSNNNDVTNHFNIVPNYNNNKVTITSDNSLSGTFTFKMEYSDIVTNDTFKLVEDIDVVNTNNMNLGTTLNVLIGKNQTLRLSDIVNNLKLKNTLVKIYDANGNEITSDSGVVGTNYTLKTNNNSYKIVVKGDVNGDGIINSADLLKIVKHLKNTSPLDINQIIGADCTNDTVINSADLLKIVKFLKGITDITF